MQKIQDIHIMPISEDLCWKALGLAHNQKVLKSWIKGNESEQGNIENAIPLFALEKELVMKYTKSQIEDSLYFLEKRQYFIVHGFKGLTRVVYQLSDAGLNVLDRGSFLPEEQTAFSEALFDIKQPGWFGLKFNLGELFRRIKKLFKPKSTKA
jgi:DNA-binding PadR family transcriptional regulator